MAEEETTKSGKLAIVLVRGVVGVAQPVKDTLSLLRLHKKNYCVVVDNNPVNIGMIKKVKDYVTWGEIDENTFKELVEKRGEEFKARLTDRKEKYSFKCLELNGKKYKLYFRLNPPRKGFGRKGIKIPFKVGGALGNRAEKINDLIKRML
jgi:large subunit ribosomal protein L30